MCGSIAIYLHTICADDPLPILFTTSEIAEAIFVVSSTATMVLLTTTVHTMYYYCCTKPLTPRQQLLNARTMRKRAFSLEPILVPSRSLITPPAQFSVGWTSIQVTIQC